MTSLLKSLIFSITILFFTQIAHAQHLSVKIPAKSAIELQKWEVVDYVIKSKSLPNENPFEVHFGAVFTGPGNQQLNIPGFYNGQNEWVVRFSSSTIGDWCFQTYSSMSKLAGIKGQLKVIENMDLDRKGAIKIDPERPQSFIYEDGSPYFSFAFELDWLFALDQDNKNGIPKTEQIIGSIKENGFNQVVMNVYAYDVKWHTDQAPAQYNYSQPGYSPFGGNNENPEFSSLNTDFFRHLDRVIHHLDNAGIVAHIMIYVWNKKVNWPAMYSKADNMYFDYVISRYQAFSNIIWDVSKEALDYGRCDIPYINERIQRIRKLDAHQRLLTVHDYEYCSREADRVDFISIQNWRPNIYDHSLLARERHSDKPVVNIEHGGYEIGPYKSFSGNYTNAETCLIRNYECAFAGVYTTYYWQNTSWNIVIYDPFNENHDFQPPRFDYYKYMAQFFKKYDYNQLMPSAQKYTTNDKEGLDNLSTGGLPLTNGKDLFIYLIPERCENISTVLPKPESQKMEITWFNPFTGEYKEAGVRSWANWVGFSSPWEKTTSILIVKLF
jgi:hypothetical protein